MTLLSASCLSIAIAVKADEISIEKSEGRFGPFWSICDSAGMIEVAMTEAEAEERIEGIRRAIA